MTPCVLSLPITDTYQCILCPVTCYHQIPFQYFLQKCVSTYFCRFPLKCTLERFLLEFICDWGVLLIITVYLLNRAHKFIKNYCRERKHLWYYVILPPIDGRGSYRDVEWRMEVGRQEKDWRQERLQT